MFSGILNVDLRIYHVQSAEDLRRQVIQAKIDGIDVVIGGILTGEYAEQSHLPSVNLGATKESLLADLELPKKLNTLGHWNRKRPKNLRPF